MRLLLISDTYGRLGVVNELAARVQAEFLGHDNLDDRVKTTQVSGVGGRSRAFIHTLRI